MVPEDKRGIDMDLDEMIPVDQFFDDYVSRLQSSAYSEELNPYAVGGVHRRPSNIPLDAIADREGQLPVSSGVYGGASGALQMDSALMQPPPLQDFDHPVGSGPLMPGSGLYVDPAYYSPHPSQGFTPPYSATEGMADYNGLPFGQSSAAAPYSTGPGMMENSAGYLPQAEFTDTSSGMEQKRTRPKTARQQQLNKLAQQRYRERKKAKALGLEQTVAALSAQLAQLKTIQKEKLSLEERNLELERKLVEKESELQVLRGLLEESKKGTGNNETEPRSSKKDDKNVRLVGLDSRPAKLFHKKVNDLKKYLKNNNLHPSVLTNPLDDTIPKKAVDDIYHLVGDVCMTCMQLTRHDGPDLWDLIAASLDSKQRESHDRMMWRSIAMSLKLGKDQVTSALKLRDQHLAKLEKIYIQRQTLNLEAIQHLLPSNQGGQAPQTTPLGCLNIATFVQRLRHSAKLSTVLDNLKDNLSKEQKLNSELEYMTFYRVMSPLQGAWFTVSAYPHQCDCLEFLNAFVTHDAHGLHERRRAPKIFLVLCSTMIQGTVFDELRFLMFGSSKRTDRIFQGKEFLTRNLGRESADFTTQTGSSFGDQILSHKSSFPRATIARRYESDVDMSRVTLPGPGVYRLESAIGKQNQSRTTTLPSWRFTHSSRWSHYASTFHERFETPPSAAYNFPGGDGVSYKIDQSSRRWDVREGLPGQKPTNIVAPGPGTYTAPESGFGNQVEGCKATMPRATVGKATPTKLFVGKRHQRVLLGTETNSAAMAPQHTSIGRQVVSSDFRRRSADNGLFAPEFEESFLSNVEIWNRRSFFRHQVQELEYLCSRTSLLPVSFLSSDVGSTDLRQKGSLVG